MSAQAPKTIPQGETFPLRFWCESTFKCCAGIMLLVSALVPLNASADQRELTSDLLEGGRAIDAMPVQSDLVSGDLKVIGHITRHQIAWCCDVKGSVAALTEKMMVVMTVCFLVTRDLIV